MPFLYGNHVLKAHLGRITEDTPEHQGVVVFSMSDVPLVLLLCLAVHPCRSILFQGFGVTARSTVDTRKLDPTAILVFHQAYVLIDRFFRHLAYALSTRDIGEYLRDEVRETRFLPVQLLTPFSGNSLLNCSCSMRWSSWVHTKGFSFAILSLGR